MTVRELTCREFIDFLMAYLDEELPAEEQAAFEAHLAICPPCVDYLESYRETSRLTALAFPPADSPVPEDVPAELVRAVLASRTRMG